MTIKIGLCGASGKVGQTIIKTITSFTDQCQIHATFNRSNVIADLNDFCQSSEVIIDFSSPDILEDLLEQSVKHRTKLVIGTTGLTAKHFALLQAASIQIPIVYSANMSIGANLLAIFAAKVAALLPNNYDISILDYHNRLKKDSPSGTALMIGKAISKARELKFEQAAVFDRHNRAEKSTNEIDLLSIRAGGIYGQHDVLFASNSEIVTLGHQALNRDSFVEGAIKAAIWVITKPPALYSMLDVLELAW